MIAIDPNRRGWRRISTGLLPLVAAVSTSAGAATITVDSNEDPGTSGDGECTLREAVASANGGSTDCAAGDSGMDTIAFSTDVAGAENLADRTIQLDSSEGELVVSQPLTINGIDPAASDDSSTRTVVVDANGTEDNQVPDSEASRILNIQANADLRNISLTGGRANDANGGIILLGPNSNAPTLTTDQATLTDGLATASGGSGGLGGAIYIASGALEFNNSQILNSRAARGGGAIHDAAGNGVTLSGSQIRQNEAGVYEENEDEERVPDDSADPADGGGLYLTGGATITDNEDTTPTRIDNNTATGSGGGVWTAGATSVVSSVVSSNTAHGDATGAGGGNIYADGIDLTLTLSTIANGEAVGDNGAGGAVLADGGSVTAGVSVLQTNFASNAGGALALRNGATASISRTVFNGNGIQTPGSNETSVTTRGGALHADGAGDITLSAGSLTSNAADLTGGAIWNQGSNVTVTGLEIRRNTARGDNADEGGGAFYHTGSGTLAIEDSRLIGNTASGEQGSGGAIFNAGGTVTLTDSDATRNSTGGNGGVIETSGGDITVTETMLGGDASDDGNMAGTGNETDNGADTRNGGAIHIGGGTVTVENSTVSYNTGVQGGGLWNSGNGTLTVRNSTLSNNQATGSDGTPGDGGGIYQDQGGSTALDFSTVTRNNAGNAGGGIAVGGEPSGEVSASGSIIANNSAATGANAVEGSVSTGTPSNIMAGDAGLDTLQLFGGPTLTHSLLSDSPAVDNAGGGDCGSAPFDLDQRGATRDGQCDTGSYERTDDPVVSVSANGPDSLNTTVGEDTLVLAFTLDNTTDSNVTLDGFSAEPLFNSGYSALLSLLPQGYDTSNPLQFEVVVDDNGNGQLDDGETTVVGSDDNGQGRDFSLNQGPCGGGCNLGANDTMDLLVIFRAPEGDSDESASRVADFSPQTPLYAGGMLLALIGVFGLTGVRRRTRLLLALAVIAVGLTACSNADDTPPPTPTFTGAPELQGDIRFRLVELQGGSSSDIVIGDGLPVYGPAIFLQ